MAQWSSWFSPNTCSFSTTWWCCNTSNDHPRFSPFTLPPLQANTADLGYEIYPSQLYLNKTGKKYPWNQPSLFYPTYHWHTWALHRLSSRSCGILLRYLLPTNLVPPMHQPYCLQRDILNNWPLHSSWLKYLRNSALPSAGCLNFLVCHSKSSKLCLFLHLAPVHHFPSLSLDFIFWIPSLLGALRNFQRKFPVPGMSLSHYILFPSLSIQWDPNHFWDATLPLWNLGWPSGWGMHKPPTVHRPTLSTSPS